MNNAYAHILSSICDIQKLGCIYDQTLNQYPLLDNELKDILRAQIVYAVSAMDRYIHEIVKIGIINSYLGQKTPTEKWKSTCIPLPKVQDIVNIEKRTDLSSFQKTTLIAQLLNQIVEPILKNMSFQHPDKIKDALSYIWEEPHKMQSVTTVINYNLVGNNSNEKTKYLEQKLQLIVTRRNKIVHEADWDITTGDRCAICKNEVDDIISFIEKFVMAIHSKII